MRARPAISEVPLAFLILAVLVLALLVGRAGPTSAAPSAVTPSAVTPSAVTPSAATQTRPQPRQFAAPGQASIRPGVPTVTGGTNGCTSNFVFTNGPDLFLGQAAHCAAKGRQGGVDGCQATTMPLGTKVDIAGAQRAGTLAYSSWIAMQRADEDDPALCLFNDLSLIKIDPADAERVNPTVLFFGGPDGLNSDGVPAGSSVFSYGSSALRTGLGGTLNPKAGTSLATVAGGWNHIVVTTSPGIPGDSGSGFLDADGNAFGVLSTLNFAPVPGSNGVIDLAKALTYANAHSDRIDGNLRLVRGTEAFSAPASPVPVQAGPAIPRG